ncbi:S24 family peptidase [Sagittula sp. NFXS13]|uniref:S24 family peptidase n=1 Tax=Sagittula sp. NFXS13 TaxID=2819095 RepID=UPI0032DECC33
MDNPSLIKNLRLSARDHPGKHPYEKILALAEVLGLEVYIGPPRQSMDTPSIAPHDNPDYALVSTYPVEVSGVRGASAVNAAADGPLAFRKEWLSSKGINVENAALLRVRGDSMQPVIWHNDLIMIDTSRTKPRIRDPRRVSLRKGYQDDIYVVELDGALLVKALRRPSEERLILVSENNARYDPQELRGAEINALRIVGKAVWWGHSAD